MDAPAHSAMLAREGARQLTAALTLACLIPFATAAATNELGGISAALQTPSTGALESLRQCLPGGIAAAGSRNHVELWFEAFGEFDYASIEGHLRSAAPLHLPAAQQQARNAVLKVRRLADFRTEQALVAWLDASLRGQARQDLACQEAMSAITASIAAQRDHAWAWADAIERILQIDAARSATVASEQDVSEGLERFRESLRRLEQYMN